MCKSQTVSTVHNPQSSPLLSQGKTRVNEKDDICLSLYTL